MEEPIRNNNSNSNNDDDDEHDNMGSSSPISFALGNSTSAMSITTCRAELSHRLYCPQPRLDLQLGSSDTNANAESSSLSYLPWRIWYETPEHADVSVLPPTETPDDVIDSDEAAAKPPTTTIQQQCCFPSVSYLDLRRQQNVQFADDKCREATSLSESIVVDDISKAKSSFTQALDLVPNHLESLIGYGKILIKTRNFVKAEGVLKSALEIDKNNTEVQQYLASLQEKRRRPLLGIDDVSRSRSGILDYQDSKRLILNNNNNNKKQETLTARESSAYQDALMERKLLADPPQGDEYTYTSSVLVVNDCEDERSYDSSDHKHNRRNKKNERRKDRRRRHKRKRSRTVSSRKRKNKDKKHRKRSSRRYDSDSSLSYSSSSCSSSYSQSSVPSEISATSQPSKRMPINDSDDESKTKTLVVEKNLQSKSTRSNKQHEELTFSTRSSKHKRRKKSHDSENGDEEDEDSSRRHKKRRRRRHDADTDTRRRHKRKKDSKRHKKKYSRKKAEY